MVRYALCVKGLVGLGYDKYAAHDAALASDLNHDAALALLKQHN